MAYSRSRFLADLTLGFADGLTVPFALTAGISSLGDTNMVIYAGLAEVSAGCLSMGVGGYLAARGEALDAKDVAEAASAPRTHEKKYSSLNGMDAAANGIVAIGDVEKGLLSDDEDGELAKAGRYGVGEESTTHHSSVLEAYLAPLSLTPTLQAAVKSHVASRPGVLLELALGSPMHEVEEPCSSRWSPVLTGLSIALGYILGGLLPLIPYFFVPRVGEGLLWSILLCVVALFLFGFVKRLLSTGTRRGWMSRCLLEGTQMAALGGLAAGVAVLSVKILRGDIH